MTLIEQRINEFEQRPLLLAAGELAGRKVIIDHFVDISRFEGLIPDGTDQRLFNLHSENKISKNEYLELCLLDAQNSKSRL
jgi:hypothetical protein